MNWDAIFGDLGALKEEAMAERKGQRGVKKERFCGNEGLPKLRDAVCNGE